MRGWTKEEIFHSGDRFFAGLARSIARAKRSIDIETYIFCDDELGRSLISKLNAAAESRGVRVRIMVDGVGSSQTSIRYLLENISPRIEVRIYHPLPWTIIWGLRRTPNLAIVMRLFLSVNRRNHRKTCIIDREQAWMGSMNICASHLKSQVGPFAWRDTGAHVEGRGVADLVLAFERAWFKCGRLAMSAQNQKRRISKSRRQNILVRLNDSWAHRRKSYQDLLAHIKSAKRRLWITNAYFVPHKSLLRALMQAARRGVDVRIMVPRRCDVFFIPWVRAAFYHNLLKSGVRIFEYFPTMLHAKTLIIDDWVVVGSSNLNHRSLHHDLEADIVMTKPFTKRCLAAQFTKDLKMTFEVNLEDWQKRPWLHQRRAQALLMLKNWM